MKYACVVAVFAICIDISLAFPVPTNNGNHITPFVARAYGDFPSPRGGRARQVPVNMGRSRAESPADGVSGLFNTAYLTSGVKGRHSSPSQQSPDLAMDSGRSSPSGRMTPGKIQIDPWVKDDIDRFFDPKNHPGLNTEDDAQDLLDIYLTQYRMFPMSREVAARITKEVEVDDRDLELPPLESVKYAVEGAERGAKSLLLHWESGNLDDIGRFFIREKFIEKPSKSSSKIQQSRDLANKYFTQYRVPRIPSERLKGLYDQVGGRAQTSTEVKPRVYAEQLVRKVEAYLENLKSSSPNSIVSGLSNTAHLTSGVKGGHSSPSQQSPDLAMDSGRSSPSVQIDPWVQADIDRFFDPKNHPGLISEDYLDDLLDTYLTQYRMFPMSGQVAARMAKEVEAVEADDLTETLKYPSLELAKASVEAAELGIKSNLLQWESGNLDDIGRFFIREKVIPKVYDSSPKIQQSRELANKYFTQYRVPRIPIERLKGLYDQVGDLEPTSTEVKRRPYAEQLVRKVEAYLENLKSSSPNSMGGNSANMGGSRRNSLSYT